MGCKQIHDDKIAKFYDKKSKTIDFSLNQGQADLTKFVKIKDNSSGAISEIDSLSNILLDKFVVVANDSQSITHKKIQDFFNLYRLEDNNSEDFIYPTIIKKEHLTIQYVNYSSSYGFIGREADSVFNSTELTSLIIIPLFERHHKGESVDCICFKVTFDIYEESNMKLKKDYKHEEKISEIKEINLDN